MHKNKRPTHPLLFALALAATAVDATALGFGAATPTATLGQTLDHRIELRLDPGEAIAPECVSAEVTVGEQRLPSAAVRARVENEGSQLRVRVQTQVAVDEPVLALTVAVGCPVQLSRRFVLFADPAPAAAPSAPLTPLAEASAPPPPVAVASAAAPVEPRPAAVDRPASPSPAPVAAAPRQKPVARQAPAGDARPTPAARAARPRLRLDAAEPVPPVARGTADLIQAAASAAAAQAAAEAASAASAAAARVAALEADMARLRAESAADREALQILRQRAARADAQAQWMPWLLALVAVLALLAAWQALKLRRLQQERQQAWWNATAASQSAAATGATASTVAETAAAASSPTTAPSSVGGVTTRPGVLGPVFAPDPALVAGEPETAAERTQALPVGWRDESTQPRDVSIEELIDLEQQAEFFVVLGQEDAAIDLLVDHLRSTGGGSPMPYLKLLEIYRRRSDREAYDRTRARFNHRFNAYAPDWDDDPSQGRSLEDYPAIVARLQQAWPSPIDAMAELEALLFRKTRGELFDLPAYRDVIFLYSLARDLLDREPLESGHVDVLLPISDGADRTQPMSLADLPAGDSAMVPLDQPTVPVDLDVTQPHMPESLFGETATDPGLGGNGRRRRGPG